MEVKELSLAGQQLRRDVIEMIYRCGDGHPGPCMSAADIVAALFFSVLRIDPARPDWEERDRFVLSKGHACPLLYAALAEKGFFPKEELLTLRALDSRLQGHPAAGEHHGRTLPGLDATAGSLGNGVSIALGMAMAARLFHRDYRAYALCGDGELSEGLIWEAALSAGHLKARNLTVIIDNNNYQSGGTVDVVSGTYPIDEKWAAFGWKVVYADGHDPASLLAAFEEALAEGRKEEGRPQVIIAKTVKGQGVSYMIGDNSWHKRLIKDDEYAQALKELEGTIW